MTDILRAMIFGPFCIGGVLALFVSLLICYRAIELRAWGILLIFLLSSVGTVLIIIDIIKYIFT